MNNKLKLIIMMIGTIFMITGCTSESPSDVVDNYFNELKKGENAKVSEQFINSVNQAESNETKESKDMIEAFSIYMSKLDAKELSEKIDGDKASVEIELSGLSLGKIMLEVIQGSLENMFSAEENTSENIGKAFLDKTKLAKLETRTGVINLAKIDGKWKINEDQDLTTLIFGNME
ncbi:hypothetical protein [Faecalimicrobium sp. JNUCC 81]